MESGGDSRLNVELGTSNATSVYESKSPLTEQEHENTHNNNNLKAHPSQNPFIVPSNTSPTDDQTNPPNKDSDGAFEPWKNEPSTCQVVESHNPFKETDEGHQGMAINHLGTSTSPNFESSNQEHIHTCTDSNISGEYSDDDIKIKSVPKHEHYEEVAGQDLISISASPNNGSEIQNPSMQVMERPNESSTSSNYVFPSHVFARNNTNTPEWSTASNESLFSIYMGNMSFSNELACFKSCEMDKPGDVYMSDQPPNLQPPTPVNKFNDISQRTAELHEEGLKVTEAKAAETMREVIMESSQTTDNIGKREDGNSNSQRQSDGSIKSYAFQT